MRARLEGTMSRRRLRGWNPPLENINALVASGGPRLLARLAIDTGYETSAVYAWSRQAGFAQVAPVKGVEGFNRTSPVTSLFDETLYSRAPSSDLSPSPPATIGIRSAGNGRRSAFASSAEPLSHRP